jgi:hypothetical protein
MEEKDVVEDSNLGLISGADFRLKNGENGVCHEG